MFANSSMSLPTTTQYGATTNARGATSTNAQGAEGSNANPYMSEYDPAMMPQQMQQAAANNQSSAVSSYLGTDNAATEGSTTAAAPDMAASLPNNPVSVPGNVSGSTDAYAAEVQASSNATAPTSGNFSGTTTSGTGASTPDGSLVPSDSAPQTSTLLQQQANPEAVATAQPTEAAQAAQASQSAPPADDVADSDSSATDAASIAATAVSDDDDTVDSDDSRSVADSNRASASNTNQYDSRDTPPPQPKAPAPKTEDSNPQPPVVAQPPQNQEVVVSDSSVSD
jgi:ribonuclease E